MAGRGHSSPAPAPRWVDVGRGVFAAGNITSCTWMQEFELTRRPDWEDLLDYGRATYEYIRAQWPDHYVTDTTGSALVATLCVAGELGLYTIFQSSIPRGAWRDYMRDNGSTQAPIWYNAAYSWPSLGSRNVALHAEDSVEFLANQKFPTFNNPEIEEPRLIVYGKREDGLVTQADLCSHRPAKNPTCQEVAETLGILFPPDVVSAHEMDYAARSGVPLTSFSRPTTMDRLRLRSNARGGSWTVAPGTVQHIARDRDYSGGPSCNPRGHNAGDGYGSEGSRHQQAPRSTSGSAHNDLSSLTRGMSALRVSGNNGRGGSGSGSNRANHGRSTSLRAPVSSSSSTITITTGRGASLSARALAGSQSRSSTTSHSSRQSTTSSQHGSSTSTRSSASQTSSANQAPAGGNSTTQHRR